MPDLEFSGLLPACLLLLLLLLVLRLLLLLLRLLLLLLLLPPRNLVLPCMCCRWRRCPWLLRLVPWR